MTDESPRSDKKIDLSECCRFYLKAGELVGICPDEIIRQALLAQPSRIVFELKSEPETEKTTQPESEPKKTNEEYESKS